MIELNGSWLTATEATIDACDDLKKLYESGAVCFVAENALVSSSSDDDAWAGYTKDDFLSYACGDERFAYVLFDLSTWAHVETLAIETYNEYVNDNHPDEFVPQAWREHKLTEPNVRYPWDGEAQG